MRLFAAFVLALLLAAIPSAEARFAFSARGGQGSGGPPPGYTPLCSVGPGCAYAYSTERQMVSGAASALQVQRSVDGATQNVGFTGAGLVNTATVDTFCNAAVGGLISRNCFISEVFDQTGHNCRLYNATASAMPDYMVDPTHQGLPRFQKVFQGGGSALNFLLDNAGGSTGTPAVLCTLLTGPAQSFFYAGNSSYAAFSSGQSGLMETTPAGGPQGAMFAAFTGPTGFTYDHCVNTFPCGGVDSEGQGPQYNYTRTGNDDFIDIAVAPTSGTCPWNVWINNNNAIPNDCTGVLDPLVTKSRMTWGNSGDHSTAGPNISRSEAFFASVLSSGQVASLYSNETTFTGSLTTAYQGPGDVVGGETSYSAGLTDYKNLQLQWLSHCFSLRKCYAAYEGPALNVCQGSGACEDIGWVNNAIDAATMSAFCGPVSGLNNCAVQIWYNEALNQASDTNGVGTGIDATAVSSSNRPTIAWSGCQTATITVCIVTSSTNYFTTNGITVDGGYTMSAVAQRTGGATSQSAILSSASTPETFIGFSSSANTCTGSAHSGGALVTVACNDNVVHGITVDAVTSPSASVTIYADGATGTNSTAAVGYSGTGLGVGATGAGVDPCACQLSEVLVYGDAHDISFNTGLGSAGVAALLANQEAAFGFSAGSTPVISVAITNENVVPGSSVGTAIGTLSAKVTGGGNCNNCTWSMVNTGFSSDTVQCGTSSNNFQVVSAGGGTATLEVLNGSLTAGIYGQPLSFVCAEATPVSGAPYIFPFSVMARGNVFTSVEPLTVQYNSPPFTGTLATMSATVHGTASAPTFTVGGDAACSGLSFVGAALTASAYSGSGVCHITVSQAGVTCPPLGGGTTPANCTAAVYISQGAYSGPGDVLPSWRFWSQPYAYSAAYAASGGAIWNIIRERDQALFTINALSNGDMDYATLANDCDTSICYGVSLADQSGSGNTMFSWEAVQPPSSTVAHRPVVYFNIANGVLPGWSNSNATDRFWWNPTAYTGTGTTGVIETVANQNVGALGGYHVTLNSAGTLSNPVTRLFYPTNANTAEIYVGPDNGMGGSNIIATATDGQFHSELAVINGSSSILDVDGVQNTGTLLTASFAKPFGIGGDFGGGSLTGFETGAGVNENVPSSGQVTGLCQILQNHFGTGS